MTHPKGGRGGGLIWMNVEENLKLDGNVTARGGNAVYNTTSGGGSGGSVQIVTTKLLGSGHVNVNGGNGTIINSGGGSAGRVSISFWKSEDISLYPEMAREWKGTIIRKGGMGEDLGGMGSEGTLYTTKCQAGYSGAF
mmetsp:Transcript_43056/g.50495  ORF Transcript_43056/g.50495 Transcript_43056/m.50495 type:complete len:138 (-) Transcript_43056:245-658(-)